jgi:hypothetical protein
VTRVTTPPGPPSPYDPPPQSYPPPYGQPAPPYGQPAAPHGQPAAPYGQPAQYPPPPPLPYSTEEASAYYQPPKKSRKTFYVVLGVLAAIFVLVIAGAAGLYFLGKDTVTATDVQVGDCLSEIPQDTRVMLVKTVSCEETHAGEVFAVLQMPDGDFPGQPAIDAYTDKCSPELATYSPAAMEDDTVQLYVLYPTEETWADGDRAVTCIATLDPPRTGSIRG